MIFRQTAGSVILVALLSGCSTAPELSKAQAAKVVTSTLEGCDSAVHVLDVNREHATPAGLVMMAQTVQTECGGAGNDLRRAHLPEAIASACQDAGDAGRVMGSAVEAAVDSREPSDEVRAVTWLATATNQRAACETAIS